MPSIVFFEVPADDPERSQQFYKKVFGWEFKKMPTERDYWWINTKNKNGEEGSEGGMRQRGLPENNILNYFDVKSVARTLNKIEKAGGRVLVQKNAVPGMGYYAICEDTENNRFALWQEYEKAK